MSPQSSPQLVLLIIIGTAIFLALAFFIVLFLFFFRQKQLKNRHEQEALREAYEQEMLRSQMEVQNETLRQVGEELHDYVGQLLAVARIELNLLEERLTDPSVGAGVRRANEALQQAVQGVRSLAKTLDSETVGTFGLAESLSLDLDRVRRLGTFQVFFSTTGTPRPLPAQGDVVVYRIVQELVGNALKHSGGTQLTVRLAYEPTALHLYLADDGLGYDPAAVAERPLSAAGSGLRNLRRRVKVLGGTCGVRSQPGQGTIYEIVVPLT
jgi:two-component system NarL family sensor kinase